MSEKVEHTELPWEIFRKDGSPNGALIAHAANDGKATVIARLTREADKPLQQKEADAAYIKLACNSYPALLAERDRLREALKEISDIKPERIADTEFTTGPLAHFQAAQRIARAALKDTNQ